MSHQQRKAVITELFKQARKNFKRRRTRITGMNDLWQMDLAEFREISMYNQGYNYVLFAINCFTKFLYVQPMRKKTGEETSKAIAEIFKRASFQTPKHVQTDLGKEFYNTDVARIFKAYNINHYSTYSIKKAAIVERVIKTIKNKIYKMFATNGQYKWIEKLQDIVNEYNKTPHRTLNKLKPIEVNNRKVEKQLLQSVYNYNDDIKFEPEKSKFRVGDKVRISRYKNCFQKGYLPSWTSEIFRITKIQNTFPRTYLLEDLEKNPIKGYFYKEEIQKAKFPDVFLIEKILKTRNNKKEAYVKWLGFDSKHNSWINMNDLV